MGNACPGRLFDTLGSETNSEIMAEKVGFKFGVDECGIERDGFTYKTLIRGEFGFENRYQFSTVEGHMIIWNCHKRLITRVKKLQIPIVCSLSDELSLSLQTSFKPVFRFQIDYYDLFESVFI